MLPLYGKALRRALFQAHLWIGIGLGVYVLLICLSGSAIVFRREMDKTFCSRIVLVSPSGPRMTDAELRATALAKYQHLDSRQIEVRGSSRPGSAVEIRFGGGSVPLERLFDPYTGQDLGDTVACEPSLAGGAK